MADRKERVGAVMGGTGEMDCPFGVCQCKLRLSYKNASRRCELHAPTFVTSKQMKFVFFLKLRNPFAQCRLRDIKHVGRPCKAEFFRQNKDCMQVPNLYVGEHSSNPLDVQSLVVPELGFYPTSVKEPRNWKKY
jgi:hypothetical protein